MLHIGKTGGSSLKATFKASAAAFEAAGYDVKGRSHQITFKDVKKAGCDGIIVFVRHPVARFVSAFNSRLRQGQPRYNSPWTPAEEVVFNLFKEPNQLAEALSSADGNAQTAAKLSMRSINHVRDPMTKWLVSPAFLGKNQALLFYLGATETMDEDVAGLYHKIGVAAPDKNLDDVAKHATPEGYRTDLSTQAIANLTAWYDDDVKVYDWCMLNKQDINAKSL